MKTRKLVALVAAIVMTLSMLPIVGASAEAPKSSSLWFENGLTIKWMTRETSQQKMDIDAPVLKAIKEATNATIELQPIPEADYDTKRKTTLASNTMPDVMAHLTTDEMTMYAEIGMFVNLDENKELCPNYFALVDADDRITETNNEGLVTYLPNWPSFNAEEMEEIVDLELNLGNVFDQEIDKFITGKRSMDEWPQLVDQLKAQGAERLEAIFNAAYDRVR